MADLGLEMTAARSGDMLTYTLTVSNDGPGRADGAVLQLELPAAAAGVEWTCLQAGGAVCPLPNLSMPLTTQAARLSQTIPALPPGGSLTLLITARLPASAAADALAQLILPAGVVDPDPANNSTAAGQPYRLLLPILMRSSTEKRS